MWHREHPVNDMIIYMGKKILIFSKRFTKKASLQVAFLTIVFILSTPAQAFALSISGRVTVPLCVGNPACIGGYGNIRISATGPSSGQALTNGSTGGSYTIGNLKAGTYQVMATLPVCLQGLAFNTVKIGPGNGTSNFSLTTKRSTLTVNVTDSTTGAGVSGVPVSSAIGSGSTDGSGGYAVTYTCASATGTVTMTVPSGYTAATTSQTFSESTNVTVNFTLTPVAVPPSAPPPPSQTPTLQPVPPPPPTLPPPPPPGADNIINLNFGITNNYPWFQSTCGDIRNDNGINDLLPAGQFANITDATCTNPGISYTGDTTAVYGNGQESASNQQAGGPSYPEVFPTSSALQTSYASLLAKAQAANIIPTDLATVCTLSNCTLPNNLSHGLYSANGDVTIANNNYTVNNGNYVFLINGTLTFTGNIQVNAGSTILFSTTKDIIIAGNVGSPPNNANSSLDGWFVAGQNFIVQSVGNCNDQRLNIAGTVIVNAQGGGGIFQNNRDLCGNDATDPTVTFSQRIDMIINAPQFLKQQQTISQELAP